MKTFKKLILAQMVLILGVSSAVGQPVLNNDQVLLTRSITAESSMSTSDKERGTLSNSIKFETLDKNDNLMHEFDTTLDKEKPYDKGMIFDEPLVITPNSKVDLDLELDILETTEAPKYQIVTSDTVPTLPYKKGKWTSIDVLGKGEDGEIIYEDIIDKPNTITAQHYVYTLAYEKTPEQLGKGPRDRALVFRDPVNGIVQQTGELGDNDIYSNQANTPAFFRHGGDFELGITLSAVFVPKVSGEYKFAIHATNGGILDIEVDKETIRLCDNIEHYQWTKHYLHGFDKSVYLEAGKKYPVHMETRYLNFREVTPSLMYTIKPEEGWPTDFYDSKLGFYNRERYLDKWNIAKPDLLQDQNPSNGCSRAVKLWGYIVPDVTGEFNIGATADDGAYGYIVMDKEPKVFVDSFGISSGNTVSTSDQKFMLKKDVAYPFYLEWYDGHPTRQALIPRYKEPSSKEWRDIPPNWFRGSTDTTPTSTPLAMFYGVEAGIQIDLPYNKHNNYMILNVTDKENKNHQVIYGPFTSVKKDSKNQIDIETFDEGIKKVHSFTTQLDANNPYGKGMLFEEPFVVSPNSDIKLDLDLDIHEESSNLRYQIVTSNKVPTLPYTEGEWEPISAQSKGENGSVVYKDMMEEPATITAQHYLYTPSYTISPYDFGIQTIRDRGSIFSEPVNSTVIQDPSLDSNTKYSTQAGEKAFFNKSQFHDATTLEAVFVPKETGEYRFSVYSATGSLGRITVGEQEITFVDNFGVYKEKKPNLYGNNVSVYLEAGKSYPMYLKTQYYSKYDTAPVLRYTIKGNKDWPSDFYVSYNNPQYNRYAGKYWPRWKVVKPDLLKEQNPSNAAARAVKLWGYIVPDVTGVFNFAIKADDGAYAYIYMDGKPKVFADSFKLSSATIQTNNEKFALKKDVAYPIYIEWYEGCPSAQALAPKYRRDGAENWKDIPDTWFRGSTSTEVVTEPLAMFYGVEASTRIKLPYNYDNNYIILDMKDKKGQNHQILYGPFTGIKPKEVDENPLKVESDYNYIVPTSVSNISSTIVFDTPSKAVSYELDLKALKDEKLNGYSLFEFPINPATISLSVYEGSLNDKGIFNKTNRVPNEAYDISILEDKIKVSFKDEDKVIQQGKGHQIDIYFKVNLGDQISYFDKDGYKWYYSTFKDIRYDTSGKVSPDMKCEITCYKKPKIAEPTYSLTTGVMIRDEQYSETLVEQKTEIGLDLKEIPNIS